MRNRTATAIAALLLMVAAAGCVDELKGAPTAVLIDDFEELDSEADSLCSLGDQCVPEVQSRPCLDEAWVPVWEECPTVDCDFEVSPVNGKLCVTYSHGAPDGSPSRALRLAFDVSEAVGDDSAFSALTLHLREANVSELGRPSWPNSNLAMWLRSTNPDTAVELSLITTDGLETYDPPFIVASESWERKSVSLDRLLQSATPEGEPEIVDIGMLAGIRFAFPRRRLLEESDTTGSQPVLSGELDVDDLALE